MRNSKRTVCQMTDTNLFEWKERRFLIRSQGSFDYQINGASENNLKKKKKFHGTPKKVK